MSAIQKLAEVLESIERLRDELEIIGIEESEHDNVVAAAESDLKRALARRDDIRARYKALNDKLQFAVAIAEPVKELMQEMGGVDIASIEAEFRSFAKKIEYQYSVPTSEIRAFQNAVGFTHSDDSEAPGADTEAA